MQARQGIVEIFSTFIEFDVDRFSGWITDPKLRRSIKQSVERSSNDESDTFWVLYWYKVWHDSSSSVALAHLSAYLQETCYWSARKFALNFKSDSTFPDYFQIAIAHLAKILKSFNPEYSSHLKSYAELAFKRIIKDQLRLRRETDICSDVALLHKISRKRLVKSLQNMGLNTTSIESYVLAWECFKELYTSDNKKIRQLTKPDARTWEAIKNLYNTERLSQLSSSDSVDWQTIEKWLLSSASSVRNFLYPKVISADSPLKEGEASTLLDILPGDGETSLMAEIIKQEETANIGLQQHQLNIVLQQAITALDAESQQLLQAYYGQQLTQKEIAAQLNIKQYTVSRHLTSIKKSLLLTLIQWSQSTLHISPKSDVIDAINTSLEEWFQFHYSHANTSKN
ncbi:MAG: sigma-70 family RNA polymerase sigma factor [Rivularia sp. (in: cyanobacteria)]